MNQFAVVAQSLANGITYNISKLRKIHRMDSKAR